MKGLNTRFPLPAADLLIQREAEEKIDKSVQKAALPSERRMSDLFQATFGWIGELLK